MKKELILEMKNIKKNFPGGVIANDKVDLKIKKGEIHALLGENGAGKSTLMNILYGLYQQDEGEIIFNHKKVDISSPNDAIELGIGMVHQHFTLVPSFSVAENIILGLKDEGLKPDMRAINKKIEVLGNKYGLKIDPEAKVWQLSVGEKQRVEILKLLYRETELLIMDEPTAVLTPQESDFLFKTLKKMVNEGKSIIFITHKMEEVMNITDRVSVLKKGKVVGNYTTANTNSNELANAMVGRTIIFDIKKDKIKKGNTVLKLENVKALNDKKLSALKGISLELAEGEILGIAGVAGNGQRELAEVISGMRAPYSGRIFLKNKEITDYSTRKRIREGLSFIPEDRLDMGISPGMCVKNNLILKDYFNDIFCNYGFILAEDKICGFAEEMVKKYNILTPDIDTRSSLLSGGNIQKLILARELSSNPDFILAVHPTRGLDIGAIEFVYDILLKERNKGKGILLIAGDMDEIFTLSDRIAVLYEGEILGYRPADESYLEDIGLLMAGVRGEENANKY